MNRRQALSIMAAGTGTGLLNSPIGQSDAIAPLHCRRARSWHGTWCHKQP
ncbi:hypothetical protein [Candidatus Pelagisphaera phototrophica]|nr:hypothetical protein [Candidatus Pelagisphaera phototrophica]QXD30850.1 hypothetical protein GA004_10820 [Candidatus Pelagisphaera phototrophica]